MRHFFYPFLAQTVTLIDELGQEVRPLCGPNEMNFAHGNGVVSTTSELLRDMYRSIGPVNRMGCAAAVDGLAWLHSCTACRERCNDRMT